MKWSIGVSILILAIGIATGLSRQKRLTELREQRTGLIAQAERLGISPNLDGSSGDVRITKRQRGQRENVVHTLGADLAAFAREMDERENGGVQDEAFQDRGMDIMSRLMELDARQIKLLVTGLQEDEALSSSARNQLIGLSLTMLGEDHPAEALELLIGSSAMPMGSPVARQVAASTLAQWSNRDPLAALEWIRRNSEKHPDLTDDEMKQTVIAGAARSDPKMAFKLIEETKLDDKATAVQLLVEAGKTPDQRTAILHALREHLATLTDQSERDDMLKESLESMGRNISEENFSTVQSWIANSKLSPQESAQFAGGLSYFNTKQDTGRWIEWMASNLPEEQLRENVENLVGQWTQQDYQAAGKWLAATSAGPAKNASISVYATTVAEYDPQTAVQWAATLPDDQERQATFESIYRNWPKHDAAAAAAFAKEHGIAILPGAQLQP